MPAHSESVLAQVKYLNEILNRELASILNPSVTQIKYSSTPKHESIQSSGKKRPISTLQMRTQSQPIFFSSTQNFTTLGSTEFSEKKPDINGSDETSKFYPMSPGFPNASPPA